MTDDDLDGDTVENCRLWLADPLAVNWASRATVADLIDEIDRLRAEQSALLGLLGRSGSAEEFLAAIFGPGASVSGTTVRATDNETGEHEEIVITDDYVLVADGTCTYSVTAHANGTHVITVKGRKR